MTRQRGQVFAKAAVILADVILIELAFLAAYWMRYVWRIGGDVSEQFYVTLDDYLFIQVAFTVILVIAFALAGLYRKPLWSSLLDDTVTMLGAVSIGMMLTLALVFVYQGQAYSRWMFFFLWLLVLIFLSVARVIRRLILIYLQGKGIGVERVLVVGGDTLGKTIMHVIATEPNLGYQLVGFVDENHHQDIGRFKSLGSIGELARVVREHCVDEVIIALPSASHHNIPEVTKHCERQGLSFRIVPDLFEISLSRVDVNQLRGIPLIGVREISIQGLNLLVKRAFDITVSAVLLIILFPLWALIALAIKLDSPGPVIFKQKRIGKGGQPFEAWKFRSMKQSAEEDIAKLAALNEATWPLFKIKNDPRITRVGRLLRRTSLDELPQIVNVLTGKMSLVGPRPPIPSEVEKYEPWHRKRLDVAPGITGLWQVSGRSELPFDEMVMLDIFYIENWSLAQDFQILLRTIPAVLTGQGAY